MTPFQQQIEQDLAWREAEMASLKMLLASAPTGSDRQRALLRACSAMLYAHYEGFCKFCWILMLDTIATEAHVRNDLVEALAKRSMISVFRNFRGDTSDAAIWQFAGSEFQRELGQVAVFPDEIDTESNLWPSVSQKINDSIGLQYPLLNAHEAELRQLVGRRNKIAHGEKLEIADIPQFQQFEHAAVLVMHELALGVAECLENKTYLRPHADPAASI
jgi:hypothetical protein